MTARTGASRRFRVAALVANALVANVAWGPTSDDTGPRSWRGWSSSGRKAASGWNKGDFGASESREGKPATGSRAHDARCRVPSFGRTTTSLRPSILAYRTEC
ncbi:hypothetical protein NDU88_005395 [Pleurodeles waltl]|uniref:Secreted protein n=1 Tax=Pleurodeles waltl TaxID=8319 RepID=A0AAV7TV88_PLEWA|nr:hypothetical protein NDU88_005395 [Pleurodeles waltl]